MLTSKQQLFTEQREKILEIEIKVPHHELKEGEKKTKKKKKKLKPQPTNAINTQAQRKAYQYNTPDSELPRPTNTAYNPLEHS